MGRAGAFFSRPVPISESSRGNSFGTIALFCLRLSCGSVLSRPAAEPAQMRMHFDYKKEIRG